MAGDKSEPTGVRSARSTRGYMCSSPQERKNSARPPRQRAAPAKRLCLRMRFERAIVDASALMGATAGDKTELIGVRSARSRREYM